MGGTGTLDHGKLADAGRHALLCGAQKAGRREEESDEEGDESEEEDDGGDMGKLWVAGKWQPMTSRVQLRTGADGMAVWWQVMWWARRRMRRAAGAAASWRRTPSCR